MRERKNSHFIIVIESIGVITEITNTGWPKMNLVSCSKGMKNSGKSFPAPNQNYSGVIGSSTNFCHGIALQNLIFNFNIDISEKNKKARN